jgi:glucose/arabinose dehydrogenase
MKNSSCFVLSIFLIVIISLVTLMGSGCLDSQDQTELPEAGNLSSDSGNSSEQPVAVVLAEDLEVPWSLDFLPDGSIIFTERSGNVRFIDPEQGLLDQALLRIDEVSSTGEGGLLGVTVHPDYENNSFIYLYYTYTEEGALSNKVVRYTYQDNELIEDQLIIDNIPASGIHNGGRIKFGPDGMLYITTGDAGQSSLAQDPDSLAGKILRLNDNGDVPEDNPFENSPVYTLGHRNPQGLAWDEQGRMWATEHGSSAHDELNLIGAGNNYGWPQIIGDETAEDMVSPVIHSGEDTWAPSGAAYLNGSVFFAGLRGESLYEASIDQDAEAVSVGLQSHFTGEFGRLRDVVAGPEGNLYLLTSNRDGRGDPVSTDDRIIRINVSKL